MEENQDSNADLQKLVTSAIIKSVMGTSLVFVGLLAGAYFLGFGPQSAPAEQEPESEATAGTFQKMGRFWMGGRLLSTSLTRERHAMPRSPTASSLRKGWIPEMRKSGFPL